LAPVVASPMRGRSDARNATDRSVGCTNPTLAFVVQSAWSWCSGSTGRSCPRRGASPDRFRDLSNGQRACRWSHSTSPEVLPGSESHPDLTRWLEAWTAGRFAYARPHLVIHDTRPCSGHKRVLDQAGADDRIRYRTPPARTNPMATSRSRRLSSRGTRRVIAFASAGVPAAL